MSKILGPTTVREIGRIVVYKDQGAIELVDQEGNGIDFPSAIGGDNKLVLNDETVATQVVILIATIVGATLQVERQDETLVLWSLQK